MPFTRDQLEDINSLISDSIRKILTGDSFIESIVSAVSATIIGGLETELEEIKSKVHKLEVENSVLREENNRIVKVLDMFEAVDKKKNIRILGIKETEGEKLLDISLKLFQDRMKVQISEDSIDSVYRLGKKQDGKTRPILVKFANVKCRNSIISQKKSLKGTK